MKEIFPEPKQKPPVLSYQVVYQGEIVFEDPCYAICNSHICKNMLQGVRPTPIYHEDI